MEPRECGGRDCKARVVDAFNRDTGKYVVLDHRNHPLYLVWDHDGRTVCRSVKTFLELVQEHVPPKARVLISHFATCPNASAFSKGKRG